MAVKLARFSWVPGALAAAAILIGGLFATPSSAPFELALYDRVQRSAATTAADDIVVITIDQASLAQLGDWPWPADVHATLLEQVRHAGARVVGFTVPIDTARDSATKRLSEAIAAHGKVVLPVEVRLDAVPLGAANRSIPATLLAPNSAAAVDVPNVTVLRAPSANVMRSAAAVGHLLVAADRDNVVRSDATVLRIGDELLPSVATSIAAQAIDLSAAKLMLTESSLQLGARSIQLDEQLRARPQYAGDAEHNFAQVSYGQVLSGNFPAASLKNKIVLIGFTDAPGGTVYSTPVNTSVPAVFVTASAVSSLLHGPTYAHSSRSTVFEYAAALCVVLFAAFALPSLGVLLGTITSTIIIALLVITEIGLLSSMHLWVRLMLPSLAVLAGLGLYALSELMRRSNPRAMAKDPAENLRALGQTFQRQGQLDLAFETYRRCPLDAPMMELLYNLGLDFERRRQLQKAAAVYNYIAVRDPNYRDLRSRRSRARDEHAAHDVPSLPPTHSEQAVATVDVYEAEYANERSSKRTPSRTLGRYEIERELGKGAMGIVYLGRDPKINRVVAIKAIPLAEEFQDEDLVEARARFFREAEMAGRLNHPAIVTVYDAGEDQGLAYIAMEYLRGQHLSHFTDPARLLPPKSVMLLVARVADALHYAHRQNVVHRDIKPANIMFNQDTDELKITDFGIARLTDTSRTKTGIVLGTPSFMSPEQLEGRALDGRSDQFALGVSLYQLLCGQLPFRAESMPRLMHKIATEPHAPVRAVRPDLPDCVDGIIDRVLAKPAEDRFANCAELASALRSCVQTLEDTEPAQPKHEWLIP